MSRPDWGGDPAPGDWRRCPFCGKFHTVEEEDERQPGDEKEKDGIRGAKGSHDMSVLTEYQYRLAIRTDIQSHLPYLHDTVLGYRSPVVIELGIQAGNSTSALLSAAGEREGALYSCDIQSREQLRAGLSGGNRRVPEEWWDLPYWHVFHGSDLSAGALAWMPAECDVLFVDTDHSEEHTVAVMEAYMLRVKLGGVALFHDTQWVPGDTDLGKPDGPVARGINRYCRNNGLAWENRPGSYGLGIIKQ